MTDMVISGTLYEVTVQTYAIKVATARLNGIGFELFLVDERWEYYNQGDTRVCPDCEKYGNQRNFRGNQIPILFPHNTPTQRPYERDPNTHLPDRSKYFDVPCRCSMYWTNMLDCLEARLHQQKLEAIAAV